jgi:hypothetical protein
MSSLEQMIKDIKKPTDWLSWGADLRLRDEFIENAASLNPYSARHDLNFGRFRGRIFGTITPAKMMDLNFRVTSEPRFWSRDSISPFYRDRATYANTKKGMDWQEGLIDVMNVKLRLDEALNSPLTLTAGRQDFMGADGFGDGWLILDGTPGDGSRTFFFDALRLSYDWKDKDTKIDVIYIDQGALNDRWLPPINHIPKTLTDQNERGVVLYISNKANKQLSLDTYFMYKQDRRQNDSMFNNTLVAKGDSADLFTFGGRLYGDLTDHWKYRMEGAYQMGSKKEYTPGTVRGTAENSVSACGVNSRVTYAFKDEMNNQLHFNYEYLSGDNPNTTKDEMFDSLWARWPMWSELYIYSYGSETRNAQTANLHRIGPGWAINPTKKMEFTANYFMLFADQAMPTRATAGNIGAAGVFSGNGMNRGQYIQTILKYKFNQHVSGHIWNEMVFPGSFYTYKERMTFIRLELMFTL